MGQDSDTWDACSRHLTFVTGSNCGVGYGGVRVQADLRQGLIDCKRLAPLTVLGELAHELCQARQPWRECSLRACEDIRHGLGTAFAACKLHRQAAQADAQVIMEGMEVHRLAGNMQHDPMHS